MFLGYIYTNFKKFMKVCMQSVSVVLTYCGRCGLKNFAIHEACCGHFCSTTCIFCLPAVFAMWRVCPVVSSVDMVLYG